MFIFFCGFFKNLLLIGGFLLYNIVLISAMWKVKVLFAQLCPTLCTCDREGGEAREAWRAAARGVAKPGTAERLHSSVFDTVLLFLIEL